MRCFVFSYAAYSTTNWLSIWCSGLKKTAEGNLVFNTERLRRGLGECWEICFTIKKQLRARFELLTTLSDSGARGDRPPFGLPTVLRFARFRAIGIQLALISIQVRRETAQTAKGWPFFLLPSSAVALFRVSATVNMAHVFPRPFAASNNAETRDRGLNTRGG